MPNRNDRNSLMDCLMNRRVVVSVLVAIFVVASLASPAIAQASTDAVLVMHFDEGSGTIVKDESGYGNDGTIYGATWTTGISGKALSFDGVDDYVDVGDPQSLAITQPSMSISVWLFRANTGVTEVIASNTEAQASAPWYLYLSSTGKVMWRRGYGSNPGSGAQFNYEVPANRWVHLVVSQNNWDASLYIDGNEIQTIAMTSVSLANGPSPVRIGAKSTGGSNFKGIIDEIAIYTKALTPEEIKAHYLAKRAGGSTKESTSDLISSVSTRIDVLKRSNVDTSLIEDALKNAQNAYDLGKYEESYELAQSALKMADDAYETQQHIESAQSEIDEAKSIGAEVTEAEDKLKEAKDALNKGNYQYAQDWADEASELAKHASIGSVQIKDLKALATKYDERTVVISGTIRDIETVYGKGYAFALDDGSGMISVAYQGSLGDIKDGDKVTASGIFQASTGTVVAENVQKSGVGGVPGFEVIFAIAGLLAVAYLLRRK